MCVNLPTPVPIKIPNRVTRVNIGIIRIHMLRIHHSNDKLINIVLNLWISWKFTGTPHHKNTTNNYFFKWKLSNYFLDIRTGITIWLSLLGMLTFDLFLRQLNNLLSSPKIDLIYMHINNILSIHTKPQILTNPKYVKLKIYLIQEVQEVILFMIH